MNTKAVDLLIGNDLGAWNAGHVRYSVRENSTSWRKHDNSAPAFRQGEI
jgi:hypothetical protein